MTDFQVGDRVRTIVGTVAAAPSCFKVAVDYGDGSGLAIYHTDYVELVERPKRKLRVGSVWERESIYAGNICKDRYVWTGVTFVSPNGDAYPRETRDFDTAPDRWREVPVEELEQEAADGS